MLAIAPVLQRERAGWGVIPKVLSNVLWVEGVLACIRRGMFLGKVLSGVMMFASRQRSQVPYVGCSHYIKNEGDLKIAKTLSSLED